MIDTCRLVETPEGIEIGLRAAGPVPRLYAWLIDLWLRGLLAFLLMLVVVGLFGERGRGVLFLGLFVIECFYPVAFEVLVQGATPGKRALGLAVVMADGRPVGWTASFLRNLMRAADFLPFAYGFGLASMLVDSDFRRLGDLAAGTVVIYRRPGRPSSPGVPQAPPWPPPVLLTAAEQRAVIEFADRAATWPEPHAETVAGLARPLTGETGAAGIARLVAMANWLLGRQ